MKTSFFFFFLLGGKVLYSFWTLTTLKKRSKNIERKKLFFLYVTNKVVDQNTQVNNPLESRRVGLSLTNTQMRE